MLKIKNRHRVCLILGFFFPVLLFSQSNYETLFSQLTDYQTPDELKTAISTQLTQALVKDLKADIHFADSLSIRQLRLVVSPNGELRIFTWHYSLSDATSQYGGIIINEDDVLPLHFNDMPISNSKKYSDENWCGGIYYDIIPEKQKGKIIYTLLAWDGNNSVTSKKIVDVLSFDRKGRAIFGLPIFEDETTIRQRVVIEYSAANSMLLEYDADKKAIISNALYVNEDKFTNVAEYYSANDAFNVYRYEDEKWTLYRNVDLRLNKKDSKVLQNYGGLHESGL